jgi:transposase
VLHRLNQRPPDGDLFAQRQRDGWEKLERSATECLQVDQDVATLDHIGPQITAVDAELRRLSVSDVWAEQVPYLVQLPGIALLSAMTLLGAIGDITRFPCAKKLVGYAGLGAGVHDSGKTPHTSHWCAASRTSPIGTCQGAPWTEGGTRPWSRVGVWIFKLAPGYL